MPWSARRDVQSPDETAKLAEELAPADLCSEVLVTIGEHEQWHDQALNLVAAHNVMSPKAKAVLSSGLADKIQSHGIGQRPHSGAAWIDRLEILTIEMAKMLFGVRYVEYRPMSGAMANAVAFFSLMKRGQRVMAVSRRHGADATSREGGMAAKLGLEYVDIPFDDGGFAIDLETTAHQIDEFEPDWLILGGATLQFPYPVRGLVDAAEGVGAKVYYDGAHVLGLMAGGCFQDPIAEGATVVTGSTQKTLPGPIGGLVLSNDEDVGESVARGTDALISNYHNNRVGALAVTLAEMLHFGRQYAGDVVRNAQALGAALDHEGLSVPGKERGYTMSHIVLLDLSGVMDAGEALSRLESAGVVCSTVALPQSYPERRGLRLGTPALTRMGMGAAEMREAALFIRRVVLDREEPVAVKRSVTELVRDFKTPKYCF